MSDYLSFASVTLTDAQIKALPTASVEVIPAAGADRLIVPVWAMCRLVNTVGYDAPPSLSDGSMVLMYPSGGYCSTVLPVLGFINVSQTMTVMLVCPKIIVATGSFTGEVRSDTQLYAATSGVNEPVVIADNYNGTETNYTGGDAANTLTVSVLYLVYDVVAKEFVAASPTVTEVPAGVPHAVYAAGGSVRFR